MNPEEMLSDPDLMLAAASEIFFIGHPTTDAGMPAESAIIKLPTTWFLPGDTRVRLHIRCIVGPDGDLTARRSYACAQLRNIRLGIAGFSVEVCSVVHFFRNLVACPSVEWRRHLRIAGAFKRGI